MLAQGEDVCPIPGTSKVAYMLDNVKAVDVQLSPEEVAQLAALVPPEAVAGHRFDSTALTHETN